MPLNLHAAKGPELYGGVYVARAFLESWRNGATEPARWVVKGNYGVPEWARIGDVAVAEEPFKTNDAESQIAAVHQGICVTTLSCFVGDADQRLACVPGSPLHLHGRLYVLTQGDTRKTERVRLFVEFISRSLVEHAALLAGQRPVGCDGSEAMLQA